MEQSNSRNTSRLVLCAMFIALITVGAYIRIPLPFGDYYTLQLLFVLLSGLLLGAKQGMLATAVYVLLGIFGLPVFAGGGGPGYIFSSSFGYLIGFVAASWCAGFLVERLKPVNLKNMMIACYSALILVYLLGLPYKYFILNYYIHTPITWMVVLAACFPVDLPCDIVLCFFCAFLAKKLYPVTNQILQTAPGK